MNKENDKQIQQSPATSPEQSGEKERRSYRTAVLAIVGVLAVVAIAFAVWRFWSKPSGKPVPVPRSISFQETQQPSTPADERLTLTPEQARSIQLKIETVGEVPSSEAAGQLATGVVRANSYKETPVISLVGGIVRTVNAELGQNVKRGQRVAMVFSNELADTQSKYLAAVATLDEHHRHHMRTM